MFRAQTTPVTLDMRKSPASKSKLSFSRLSSRRHSARGSEKDYAMTMTDLFETLPMSARGSTRSTLSKKKSSGRKKSIQTHGKSSKFSSKNSSRYSVRTGTQRSRLLKPKKSRGSSTGSARIDIATLSGKSYPRIASKEWSCSERGDGAVMPIPEGTTAESTGKSAARSSTDSTLEILTKRTIGSQTQFKDDIYGPLHESLPPFIQKLRERRVAAAAARGHRSSTKLHTSSRSTQTRPYSKSGGKKENSTMPQYVIQKIMKQQEEMLHALALLKKDNQNRSSSRGTGALSPPLSAALCQLNLEFAAEDRHCESPDTDVYSEFNSPRSQLEAMDLKLPGRRRFATEPRRTISGRHVIPGQEEDSSGDSDAEGNAERFASSPKQKRFSNVPPLNLAKTKISSAVMTPRSYGSETATTRSSPDRSRKCSMRLSSYGAFNPLSNRSARSGISSSRSLLSLSSLGAVLDEATTKDHVSFASASENRSETSTAASLAVQNPSEPQYRQSQA